MRVLSIADIHLSKAFPKPMTIFGPGWDGHPEEVFVGWKEVVRDEDIVVIAGDISWAMRFQEAMADLLDIAQLPGRKILLRGNHDYWWPSVAKLRSELPPEMFALQNDSLVLGGVAFAGSRGWDSPGSREFSEEDAKIYKREIDRLELSLRSLGDKVYSKLVLALHYPPFSQSLGPTGFTELIERYRPDCVTYGHLHGADPDRLPKDWKGIPLVFVSADVVKFRPQVLLEV